MTVELVPLTEDAAALAASWFIGDDEGAREFGGFYGAHPKWWELVSTQADRHGFIVQSAGRPCGFVDLERLADGSGHVAVYVRSDLRGQGLGRESLRRLAVVARGFGIQRLQGAIDPGNASSLAAAIGAGGDVVGTDEDGYTLVRASIHGP